MTTGIHRPRQLFEFAIEAARAPASGVVDDVGLSRAWLATWLVLVAVIWFASLGLRSLVHTDEGRYATLALGMARSGDWITPRLNGLLYFEKPPLQYWLGALSIRLLGISEFSARLWPGLAGFLTVVIIGFTARRLWGAACGVTAFAVAASTTWIVAGAHVLTLDAGLTLFLTLTLCAVLLAECASQDPAGHRHWIWVAWLAMAGAVLSKGPVGVVIPLAAVVLASLWLRDSGLLRRLRPAVGLPILLAVAAPWFVVVSLRNPGFAEFFFIHEHVVRYLTHEHQRLGAWWYYLPMLLAGLLPWTGALPWIGRLEPGATDNDTKAIRLLLAWAGFVLVFFSLSGSKLPTYILPMFPALCLLVARQIRRVDPATLKWHVLPPVLAWMVILVGSTQIHRLDSLESPHAVMTALGIGLRVSALLFLAGAAAAVWFLGRHRLQAAVLSVALGHLAAMSALMQAHDAYGQLKSAAALSARLLPLIGPDTPVFAVRSYDQTLPFYLRRDVVLVDYADEFAFGQQHEPGKSLATLDDFVARWQALPQGAAYMVRPTWRELSLRGVPMRVVFEDPRHLVVTKP